MMPMRSRFLRAIVLASCVIALVGVAACSRTPETRFYILSSSLPAAPPPSGAAASGPIVGLRPVTLPEQLDRPEIVTRSGANVVMLGEFDQWAAPLRDSFPRVLAEDLAILIPADRVILFPWSREAGVDFEVIVDVVRFDGTLGGESTLVADWTIAKRGGKKATVARRSRHTEPAGVGYADLVAAQSRLIAALGRDIAQGVKDLPR
jgi:uncharacterized lipoprotein YmbA